MGRPLLVATVAALVAAVLTLGAVQLLLSSQGDVPPGPVAVAAPDGVSRGELDAELACARLGSQLPAELVGLAQRPVAPPDLSAAAWGEPPVVLRCGVRPPEGYDPAVSEVLTVRGTGSGAGVSWFAEPGARRATAVDRAVFVEVTAPAGVAVADVLAPLSGAVSASLPFDDGRTPGS